MKKSVKKLVLGKETVRSLEASDLGQAGAGWTDLCSGRIGCATYVCVTSAGPYACAYPCIRP